MEKTILVLEGHDGAGKTTLARLLAEALGGAYVRPFEGDVGPRLLAQIERGDLDGANATALTAVERAVTAADAPLLVCDRHWLTLFARLPEPLWAAWGRLPPTALCWADLNTTLARLAQRQEASLPRAYHVHCLRRYWDLGQRFACPVVRTDRAPVATCLEQLHAWARRQLGRG